MLQKSYKVFPYVYKLVNKNTGQFYIGYRESNKTPSNEDIVNYKSSSKRIKENFNEYDWHIIAEFFNGTDAYNFEQETIFENFKNPLCLNRRCFYKKSQFKCDGHSIESRLKMSSSHNHKPRTKGKTTVKDKNGSTFIVDVNDSRLISGELVGVMKGRKYKSTKTQTTCPHCQQTGNKSNMTRYHFDNCQMLTGIPSNASLKIKKPKKSIENYKKSKSKEHRDNISKSLKNRKLKTAKCMFCSKEMDVANLSKYHNDNCKYKF